MDCSPPDSSLHRILWARTLERVAMPSSSGIFLTQGLNPHLLCLLHLQASSQHHWCYLGSPIGSDINKYDFLILHNKTVNIWKIYITQYFHSDQNMVLKVDFDLTVQFTFKKWPFSEFCCSFKEYSNHLKMLLRNTFFFKLHICMRLDFLHSTQTTSQQINVQNQIGGSSCLL